MKVIMLAVLVLAGCATTSEPITVVQEVKIPVAVRCKVKFPTPPPPLAYPDPDTTYNRVVVMLQDGENQRWYAKELEAALASCADRL